MTITEATKDGLAAQKRQSVKDTRKKLELALRRLANGNPCVVKKGTRVSASAVAKEAGVDRVTLYRFHLPVLMEIQRINDSRPKSLLKASRSDLAETNIKLREYRLLVEKSQNEVETLASINYRLDARISELEDLLRSRDARIAELLKLSNQ